ncbi:hypothetical protein PIB30_024591 [Stylosanthes scabra]|uniref:Uncharacterized protein n=1 Tax=Stylosanthes scabra TaxID=79078 RepID=A0ABU6UBP4_9FABA|nr:hypothetical protein [Stylosanthes scabra]
MVNYKGGDGGKNKKGEPEHENEVNTPQNGSGSESSGGGDGIGVYTGSSDGRREEEEVTSRVQETQTFRETIHDCMKSGRTEGVQDGDPKDVAHSSPTKTKSLEDDRRTEEVARELGLCESTKPSCNMDMEMDSDNEGMGCGSGRGTHGLVCHSDSNLIFPLGRETRGKSKVKRKESRKKTEKKRRAERRANTPIVFEEGGSDSMETISKSEGGEDVEDKVASRTWMLGARLGISSTEEESVRNCLKETETEANDQTGDGNRRRRRSRNGRRGKKVGVPNNFNQ